MVQAADSWTWGSLPKSIFAPEPNRMPRPTKNISTPSLLRAARMREPHTGDARRCRAPRVENPSHLRPGAPHSGLAASE